MFLGYAINDTNRAEGVTEKTEKCQKWKSKDKTFSFPVTYI